MFVFHINLLEWHMGTMLLFFLFFFYNNQPLYHHVKNRLHLTASLDILCKII